MNKIQMGNLAKAFGPKDIYSTEALKSMYIDLCCKESNLQDTSENSGIAVQEINTAVQRLSIQKNITAPEIIDWDLNTLIDCISDTHQFTRKNAVRIYDLAQKVAYRHSSRHPELTELVTVMFFFLHDLLNHMMKEEQVLFPNIRQLLKDKKGSTTVRYSTFGLIRDWARHMQKEHLSACKSLKLLNQLSTNYSIPPDACNMYKSLFGMMREFEAGFLMLMHIENNILFPKALAEDGESD